jgi:hypothetical protein
MHLLRAYLDAGSGSMILQVIIGGFAAAAVSLKLFWRRILTLLHIRKPEQDEESSTTTTTPAAEAESRDEPPAVVEPTR